MLGSRRTKRARPDYAGARNSRFRRWLAVALGARKISCSEFPVEEFIDHRRDVIRALVLIVEIVRMFPDVNRQQRSEPLGQRKLGIGCLNDFERMPVGDEPSPAAAELLFGGLGKLLLECIVTSECGIDLLGERRAGLAATFWLQRVPVKVVIPSLRRAVEEFGLVGLSRARHYDLVETLPFEVGPLDELVDLVDIRLMVFAMMKAQRPCRDHGCESILGIRQWRQ